MSAKHERRRNKSPSQARHEQARAAARAVPPGRERRRKVLSQNLLDDPAAIRAYLASVGSPGIDGVEVGAGDGRLTVELATRVCRLTAVEIDPRMAGKLRERTRKLPNVEVLEQDVISMSAPAVPFVLLGNIPFAITTQIVTWALAAPSMQAACLITQREYARKRTGDYGRWSLVTLRTWPWWDWSLGPRVHRSSFRPAPAVDAAVLNLYRRREPLVTRRSEQAWLRLVETGFSGVGGSLHASLTTLYPRRRVDSAFSKAGVARDEVVAFVTPSEWVAIFSSLSRQR